MKRFVESCALCLLMSACFHADAMPLGVRTLMHGHAMARQSAEVEPQTWPVTVDSEGGWTQQVDGSWKSNATDDGATNSISMTVVGLGTITFRCKTSCEDYFNFKGMLIRQDGLSFIVDGEELAFANGVMSRWMECSFEIDETGSHTFVWAYTKDVSGSDGEDCAWVDSIVWTPSGTAEAVAVEVNGAAIAFETTADGRTRTAAVEAGTTAEDIKILVGGVDVTAGFRVAVEGTAATVVLREPFELRRDEVSAPYQENADGKTVTLNVEVVPGLYYAADSAATLDALKRPGVAEPAKAGDAIVAPKQKGSQGFYKVWVSDAPIEAE